MTHKKKKISIKDIAKEAGVTISTVSNVLNNTKFVREATAERVRTAVDKLGYRPNRIARSLRTQRTGAVGIIVPDITIPFYAYVIQAMERAAIKRGYTIILGCTFYNPGEEEQQVNLMVEQFIDGLVFFGGYDTTDFIHSAQSRGIPVVAVDRETGDPEIPSVLVNNITAVEKAVDFLAEHGHKEIGYFTFGLEKQTVVRRRYEGYRQGLQKHNFPFNPDFVIIDDTTKLRETAGTYASVKKHFKNRRMPSAFITLSDCFAYGLIKAVRELGYSVPKDVSVIGFCDDQIGEYFEPALTTIVQPMEKMGYFGMNMLLDLIENKNPETLNRVLHTDLAIRESVAAK